MFTFPLYLVTSLLMCPCCCWQSSHKWPLFSPYQHYHQSNSYLHWNVNGLYSKKKKNHYKKHSTIKKIYPYPVRQDAFRYAVTQWHITGISVQAPVSRQMVWTGGRGHSHLWWLKSDAIISATCTLIQTNVLSFLFIYLYFFLVWKHGATQRRGSVYRCTGSTSAYCNAKLRDVI